jgi:hypothetical protein
MTNHRELTFGNQALQRLTGGWAIFNCGRTRVKYPFCLKFWLIAKMKLIFRFMFISGLFHFINKISLLDDCLN